MYVLGFFIAIQSSGVLKIELAANIDMAVRACREERGELLKNQQQMRIVKESLNDGYCDISGHSSDLICVGAYKVVIREPVR